MNREEIEAWTLGGIGAVAGAWKYYVRPEITAKRSWLAIGAFVAVHELACPDGELLSQGVDKAIEKHPVLTTLAVGGVALHLINAIPEKYDPIHQLVNLRT